MKARPQLDDIDRLVAQLDAGSAPAREAIVEPARPLLTRLLDQPAAREALLSLRRLIERDAQLPGPDEPRALDTLAKLLGSGPELGRMLARRPERVAMLREPDIGRAWSREELARDLAQRLPEALDLERLTRVLAIFRNDHVVRLAACEFGLAPLEQVGLELSNLADVCLDTALRRVVDELAAEHGAPRFDHSGDDGADDAGGLAAIAMGKYGAQELNFCSDIDIIFVYQADAGQAGALSLHEFFATACQRVVKALSDTTEEGAAFRVDLRLRPEGARGPICNSFASAERYYETWGGPYDRLAWLKARPAAGARALGETLTQLMRPFVFPRASRPEIIEQLLDLSQRIRAELGRQQGAPGWNVKLGEGGIRDVEFFVQALQLLHGGRQPALRERGTLRALDELLFCGFISDDEHRVLAEAYDLLRKLEHRLQLHGGHQTHLLPDAGSLRDHVIRHLGYEPAPFAIHLAALRERVQQIYATLGAPEAPDPLLVSLSRGEQSTPPAEALERLTAAGFCQPERALGQLRELGDKPWGPFGSTPTPVARRVAPALLAEISGSPDPDAALNHVVELSLRFGPFDGLWRMLDENRDALRLLCNLFGTSDYLARMFINHPELVDQLLLAGQARAERERTELSQALAARLHDEHDLGQRLARLRQFRNAEVLRIGLRDIAGDLALDGVWHQLTAVAETVLDELFRVVLGEVERRYGHPRHPDGSEARMAVLGLGKLGGRELSYASDLDLIFVHSGAGETDGARSVSNGEFFARLAQRLVNGLSLGMRDGRLYEVDTRLRPSGQQGALVVSFGSFRDYHRENEQVWERQTLLKARPVAGDGALGAEIADWIGSHLYGAAPEPARVGRQVAAMRTRIERELAAEDRDFYNLKLGRGGLLDVEFVAQYLQLVHGYKHMALRGRSTLETLQHAERLRLIERGDAAPLIEGYRFLRRLESRLRIVRDRSAERLPRETAAVEVVARRLGYRKQGETTAGTQLLSAYRAHTVAVRRAYEAQLGSD